MVNPRDVAGNTEEEEEEEEEKEEEEEDLTTLKGTALHLDRLEVDVSVPVESCHGCLQHSPRDGFGSLRLTHNHDSVT